MVSDRQHVQKTRCRLSWLFGMPIDREGLLSRLIFGFISKPYSHHRWYPQTPGYIGGMDKVKISIPSRVVSS